MERTSMEGRTVLVTGASGGIGQQLAVQLAASGAIVMATGRDSTRLAALGRIHPNITPIVADVGTATGRLRLAEGVGRGGGIDVLVNNAGTQTPVDARRPVAWDVLAAEIEVNLAAPVHLLHLLLPLLLERATTERPAIVVNVTSGLALAPKAASAPYCATKAGLRSYTKALRWQLRDEPIRIVEVLPPLVKTAMTAGRNEAGMPAEGCAREIISGLRRGRTEIYVGKAKLLRRVMRVAPSLAERKMRDT